VLRKDAYYEDDKPNVGNLLFHQLFGARLFLVTKAEYVEKGQAKLLEEARVRLMGEAEARKEGESADAASPVVMCNPFVVPVGGSSLTGLFGYVEFIRELEEQLLAEPSIAFDEIAFSCGSGGTATGLVVGRLFCDSQKIRNAKLIGYTACDFPHVFHQHVNEMLDQLGVSERSENLVEFIQSKNLGYAINTPREIDVIMQISRSSGVILDTCYSGKAMVEHVRRRSGDVSGEERRESKRTLFIHTGGIFSIFGKPELFQQTNTNS
jgi:1-aminocyclopropane-1-carboxylate deaminase/D-cysteine desulfhydrase-like pyridoxal-dependent ACC family enzyme